MGSCLQAATMSPSLQELWTYGHGISSCFLRNPLGLNNSRIGMRSIPEAYKPRSARSASKFIDGDTGITKGSEHAESTHELAIRVSNRLTRY